MKLVGKILFPAAMMALHSVAGSATATSTLLVTATVSAACIVSTSPVAFGVYNPTAGTVLDGTGSVAVTCTNGTSYAVSLDGGGQADVAARAMANVPDLLSYQLYSDAARTTVWGSTGGDLVNATGTGLQVNHTVYGRVPASQNVPVGSYTDTVNVTVTYN